MKNTILIVDDELSMRKFFEVTLAREGYEVLTGDSVKTGLARIRGEEFDLLLSDIKLGDGQGLELLACQRAVNRVAFNGPLTARFAVLKLVAL